MAHNGNQFESCEKYSKKIEQNADKCSGFFDKINKIKLQNFNIQKSNISE